MPKVKTKPDRTRPPRLSRQYLRDQQWVFDHESELEEKYPNEWIVVHKGEVLATGDKAFDIWRRAKELGLEQPFLFLVEKGIHVYLTTQKEIFARTIKAYLAEDDAIPLLLGVEDLLTQARLVCDYPKSKAFLQV